MDKNFPNFGVNLCTWNWRKSPKIAKFAKNHALFEFTCCYMNILMTPSIIASRKIIFDVVWGHFCFRFRSRLNLKPKMACFGEFLAFFMVFDGFLVNFECFTWFLMSQNKHVCVEKNIHITTIKISTFKMCILCTYWIICIWHIWQIGLVLRRSQILAPIWNIVLGNISTRIYYPHFLSTLVKYSSRV